VSQDSIKNLIISFNLEFKHFTPFLISISSSGSTDLHLVGHLFSFPKQLGICLVKKRPYCRWIMTQFCYYVEKYPMLIIFITKVAIWVLLKVIMVYLNSS